MPAATPNLALPYPVAADTADIPRDIKALADKLDLSGTTGTGLPGSPVDGQLCYVVADATLGLVWQFRYRAASASPYKWEFVGGGPLYAEITTVQTIGTASYVTFGTGPQIQLPLAGDYHIDIGFRPDTPSGLAVSHSYKIGATAAVDADAVTVFADTGRVSPSAMRRRRKDAMGAVLLVCQLRATTAAPAVNVQERWISATPIRVG